MYVHANILSVQNGNNILNSFSSSDNASVAPADVTDAPACNGGATVSRRRGGKSIIPGASASDSHSSVNAYVRLCTSAITIYISVALLVVFWGSLPVIGAQSRLSVDVGDSLVTSRLLYLWP